MRKSRGNKDATRYKSTNFTIKKCNKSTSSDKCDATEMQI